MTGARALDARARLGHADLAGPDGGRSACPGRLKRGRQHPSERMAGRVHRWTCGGCGAHIHLDPASGTVTIDTSRPETVRAVLKRASELPRPRREGRG